MPGETVAGRSFAWSLIRKLGEGDAGEVFWVESLLDKHKAILKRPARSAFTADIVRQAGQIERESQVLTALAVLGGSEDAIRLPLLIDQAKTGLELTEKYFIVMDQAGGIDLNSLAKWIQQGSNDPSIKESVTPSDYPPALQSCLENLASSGVFPEYLILRVASAVIDFLEKIHSMEINLGGERYFGLIWNDFKPEHIFWDAQQSLITLIDWGNANFLEADGGTPDRLASRIDDYLQFVQTLGGFIASVSPDLYSKLIWPEDVSPANVYTHGIRPLKERLQSLISEQSQELQRLRLGENDLLATSLPSFPGFLRLLETHQRIITMGEMPEFSRAEDLAWKLADDLIDNMQLEQFKSLAKLAAQIPAFQHRNWQMMQEIASHSRENSLAQRALSASRSGNFTEALWLLRQMVADKAGVQWWYGLTARIRQEMLGAAPLAVTPFTALNRLVHALLSITRAFEPHSELEAPPEAFERMVRILKESLIPRWKALEPDPPASGVEYLEIERLLPELTSLIPSAGRTLEFALELPLAQMRIVMDAWERQDFELSSQALRRLLLWDPERLRVFTADKAIQSAPLWLESIKRGPNHNEPLQDHVTRLELQGRDIRNQVGPAGWLDETLSILSRLRKESDPADLILEFPQMRDLMGWIFELETDRPAISLSTGPVPLERLPVPSQTIAYFHGSKESALGKDFHLLNSLDSWTPEAKGSSARVFLGVMRHSRSHEIQSAVKLMRPDKADYALPLFREEVQVLTILQDTPGVVPLIEFGFIQLEKGSQLPPEDRPGVPVDLIGKVKRFGRDTLHQFLANLNTYTQNDWIPYLAVELQDRTENLLMLCDASYTRGRFLPILDGLRLAIQICDILQVAHSRNIIYRDHKILHYYWREKENGVVMIDWNIARRFPEGLTKPDIQFDLVQFCARALHHILTGRPASGSLPLGPTRPEEIEAAAHSYPVRWTYDDQRLPKEIKAILSAGMQGEYIEARQLREHLYEQFQALQALVPTSTHPVA